jgi:hypothetical protein
MGNIAGIPKTIDNVWTTLITRLALVAGVEAAQASFNSAKTEPFVTCQMELEL